MVDALLAITAGCIVALDIVVQDRRIFEPPGAGLFMSRSVLQTVFRLAVGVCLVALVMHTWLVMGIVVPVTVAGSSMAPTLNGPQQVYRCNGCQQKFAVFLDESLAEPPAVCPQCGRLATEAVGVRWGDRLLIDRTAFMFRDPRRWEVVVFRSPEDPRQLCVKRVVGLPGERVALVNGDLLVDGKRLDAPRGTHFEIRPGDRQFGRQGVLLGPAEFYVVGDNAAISDDSRSWLPPPGLGAKLLIGRPLGVR